MIQLTRLNDRPLTVNSDLIKSIENSPDTVLTLVNGEKIIVRERVEEVIDRVIQFRRCVLGGLTSVGANMGLFAPQPEERPDECTEDEDAMRSRRG